ncbi:MAG: ArsR/SmtB family transcription factor [Chloroflexota bacterium]
MTDDQLSRTFAALSNPTRRAILERLARGEATVSELAEPFQISLPAISRHLRVLEEAGLITKGRDAQWRPCRLEAEPLMSASTWIEQYRQAWEGRFRRLDEHLRKMQAKENTADEHDDDGNH